MIDAVPQWDKELFYAINGFRNEFFDAVMPVLSYTWLLWVLGLAAFALWGIRALRQKEKWKHMKPVLFGMVLILSTAGITDIVTMEVKSEIGRLRPYQKLPFAHYLTHKGWRQNPAVFKPRKHRADSFFSGHASHSMAVAVTAATLCPPLSPVIFAMPVAVGYSRIYLGKHYPSDVVGGWAVGALIALLARRFTRGLRKRLWPQPPSAHSAYGSFKRWSTWRAKAAAGSTQRCSPSKTSQSS
ncbi:phosphatase PAP2 family protein [Desulfovibrio sp. OttesenSCG-928-O18]|nr:phosphatase PAP2 family protein [Desulfovibrio sp. OttesenSCG-928-O18]